MGRGTSRTRRLAVTLGVNVALAAGQVVAGVVAHSTGLLADAGHNITDVAGITMSLVAVRWALRPGARSTPSATTAAPSWPPWPTPPSSPP